MLRECQEHGYFRGDICPVCGDEGKFLMSDEELSRISKAMAGSLRHFPEKFELQMDEQGFVSIQDFIFAMKKSHPRYRWLRPHHIIALIETDEKGRYQISNDKMRATYGHTLELNLQHPPMTYPQSSSTQPLQKKRKLSWKPVSNLPTARWYIFPKPMRML